MVVTATRLAITVKLKASSSRLRPLVRRPARRRVLTRVLLITGVRTTLPNTAKNTLLLVSIRVFKNNNSGIFGLGICFL